VEKATSITKKADEQTHQISEGDKPPVTTAVCFSSTLGDDTPLSALL
jgi:hypothetical protein